jgi:hypothetical protein
MSGGVISFSPEAAAACLVEHLDRDRVAFVLRMAMEDPKKFATAFNASLVGAVLSGKELAERLYEVAKQAHLAGEA